MGWDDTRTRRRSKVGMAPEFRCSARRCCDGRPLTRNAKCGGLHDPGIPTSATCSEDFFGGSYFATDNDPEVCTNATAVEASLATFHRDGNSTYELTGGVLTMSNLTNSCAPGGEFKMFLDFPDLRVRVERWQDREHLRGALEVKKIIRKAPGAALAVVLVVALAAASPASAARPPAPVPTPVRVVYQLHPFTIPAGDACSFDVAGQPEWGFSARTYFPDGRTLRSVRAHGAYVNVATGATYPTADNFRALEQFDLVTGIYTVVINGQGASSFLPGDDGPFGLVTEPSFYDFVGTFSFKYDTNTNQTADFSFVGTVTDICAALS